MLRKWQPKSAQAESGAGQPTVSLKAVALRLLSRREFSRHELATRLAPRAQSPDELRHVLDDMKARRFQSDERFAESLVHRRAPQFGARRIEFELDNHRIDAVTANQTLAELATTERERAMAVWRRKFSSPAHDLNEKARQYRFLAQRGFEADTISWVLRQVKMETPQL